MFTRGFLRLILLTALLISRAHAATTIPLVPQFKVTLKDVDERGGVKPLNWPVRGEWIWDDPNTEVPYVHPKFRLWILVPKTESLVFAKSSVNTVTRGLPNSPLVGEGEVIAIDTLNPTLSARIRWEDSEKRMVNGIIQGNLTFPSRPFIFVHPSCVSKNLAVTVSKKFGHYLFFGMSCADAPPSAEQGSFVVVFHRSQDASWVGDPGHTTRLTEIQAENPSAEREAPAAAALHRSFLVKPIDLNAATGYTVLASMKLKADQGDGDSTIYAIYENTKPPLFNGNFELSTTFLGYQEPSSKTAINQFALTGKFGLSYHLVPKTIDLGVSAFMNLLPITISSSAPSLPSSRFFGVNGRVGYFLPVKIPRTKLLVMGGWYMWGMLVPPGSNGVSPYGIQYLTGPQLFVVGLFTPPHLNPCRAYLKFASISSSVGAFSFLNSEIAAGGAYTLGTKVPGALGRIMRRFYVSLDFSRAQYSSAEVGVDGVPIDSMSLVTVSGGFGFEF